ncbi:MAG: thiopurine S-methyltransferase [Gammaproteobacteria bacterium]|nr:thiopurine S-methyltransferase [Gammaproteobacteria bacterium]
MEPDFWHKRWHEKQIGFHLSEYNERLIEHYSELNLQAGDNVFIPLSGKTKDIHFFVEKNCSVIGCELSPIAVQDFFHESELHFESNDVAFSELKLHQSNDINIYEGDFFSLNSEQLSTVNVCYDRAALVALPQEMRKAYAQKLISTLPDSVRMLLVTLEYDQELKQGPPFSVTEEEVYFLYQDHFKIQKLSTTNTGEKQPKVVPTKAKSASSIGVQMIEKTYLLHNTVPPPIKGGG